MGGHHRVGSADRGYLGRCRLFGAENSYWDRPRSLDEFMEGLLVCDEAERRRKRVGEEEGQGVTRSEGGEWGCES